VPRGYDPDHPFAEDLKRKDFTVGVQLSDKEVLKSDFLASTLAAYRKMAPFVSFLSDAVGVP
ncbi:MAG TPA: DUF2461 family protein, partial [Nitrospirota bacterium]|nr:DUF2461 family protein [Nitrospirota bacterium]